MEHPFMVSNFSENYQLTKYAEGGMGEIFLYEEQDSNKKYIFKSIKSELKEKYSLLFLNEMFVNYMIDHPNIVKLHKITWMNER